MMKKYQFPLEKVLKIKTIELDRLVIQLIQVRSEIDTFETQKALLLHYQEDINREYLHRIATSISGYELSQLNFKKENAKKQIKQITQKINDLKQNEALILTRVIEKKMEQSGLNKLNEKLLNEYTHQALKKENAMIDEMLVFKMNEH